MRDLVVGLIEGDPTAWAELYDRLAHRLYHYALIQLGHESSAKDLLQETFLSLYQMRQNLAKIDDLEAYSFIMMRNNLKRHFRQRRRQIEQPLDGQACFVVDDSGPTGMLQDHRDWIAVNLQRLEILERETIQLKIYADLTFDQIAKVTQTAGGTVATRYRRAIQKLAKRWKEDCRP